MLRTTLLLCSALALAACDEAMMADLGSTVSGEAPAPPPAPNFFPEPQPLAPNPETGEMPSLGGTIVPVTGIAAANLGGPLRDQLAGRTLTGTGRSYVLDRDGTFLALTSSGQQITGFWDVREGALCTTVEATGETDCDRAVIIGDQVTLNGGGRDLATYTLG